ESRLIRIDDGRSVPRTGRRPAAALPEKALHDPVFEAVKGDDRKSTARLQGALGGPETLLQLIELGVEVNADGLEGAGRRVALLALAESGGTADDRRELCGAFNRTPGDDGAGDHPGARLLPIVAQDPGDLGLVGRVQKLGGSKARTAHPHVERAVGLEGETAIGAVELHRAHPDIERNGVHEADAALGKNAVHLAEVLLDELEP